MHEGKTIEQLGAMVSRAAAKHTPGPWSLDSNTIDLITADCDGLAITYVDTEDRTDEENDANAALIKASPDMLAALKSIQAAKKNAELKSCATKLDALIEISKLADAAISKATGGAQ